MRAKRTERIDIRRTAVHAAPMGDDRPHKVRDAIFVDENTLRVNCGKCGKEVLIRLEGARELRTIECDDCAQNMRTS